MLRIIQLVVLLWSVVQADQACRKGFSPVIDSVTLTLPYPYRQVFPIIANFDNIAWAGVPPNQVTLNRHDNAIGSTRTYTMQGIQFTETLVNQWGLDQAPYHQVVSLDMVKIQPQLHLYTPGQLTEVDPACGLRATTINVTAHICATDPDLAASLHHQVHLGELENLGKTLGGATFVSCQKL